MKYRKLMLWMCFLLFSNVVFSNEIIVQNVSSNVYVLTGKDYGTNIGLIEIADKLILIDPMPGETHFYQLDKTINEIVGKRPSYILNTHDHSDHTGGNAYFKSNGAQVLETSPIADSVQAIGVNSHSSKDTLYYLKGSNILFVGDVYDTSWHPTFYSGGTKGFNEAIETILNFADAQTIIVPGHGPIANKAALVTFRDNTNAWIERISYLHYQGLSTEMIMKDEQVLTILEMFSANNKSPVLPEKAISRFIERTISVVESEHKH